MPLTCYLVRCSHQLTQASFTRSPSLSTVTLRRPTCVLLTVLQGGHGRDRLTWPARRGNLTSAVEAASTSAATTVLNMVTVTCS